MKRNGPSGGSRERRSCRICGGRRLQSVLSLGRTALANAFVPPDALAEEEPRFPLRVARCLTCGLVQLRDVVDRDRLFGNYVYFSSATATMPRHFATLAGEARRRYAAGGRALAVEIGSNDGTLLRNLVGTNVEVLGIEPARNIARVANANGVRTWNEYFGRAIAGRIRAEFGRARLLFSNNVLAHIDDVHEVAAAAADLLEDEGAWIIEVPHLLALVRHVEFDTIYHEHLSYFSLPPLERLMAEHDLLVSRVEHVSVHGGSLRITVRRARAGRRPDATVAAVRSQERRAGLYAKPAYARFRRNVERVRRDLPRLLRHLRTQGHRIVGYGAPAKGNTLLNYCGIDGRLLEYLVDTTPAKQGLHSPGTHLPVRSPEAFHGDPPAYALLLAWNFEAEILEKEAGYLRSGGRFIRPIPVPEIVPFTRPGPIRVGGFRAKLDGPG